MSEIAPCITVETLEEYKATIERIKPFARRVHIDVSDGQFAPVLMVAPEQLYWQPDWTVDIHAMVMQPKDYVDKLITLRPNLITFHSSHRGIIRLCPKITFNDNIKGHIESPFSMNFVFEKHLRTACPCPPFGGEVRPSRKLRI